MHADAKVVFERVAVQKAKEKEGEKSSG